MPDLILNNKKFNYQIIRKKISSIRLSLKSSKKILITCPWLTPDFVIKKFINSNADWIIKNSQKIIPVPQILSIQKIKILDIDYQLIINKTSKDSVVIFEDDHKIFINTNRLNESHLKTILEKRMKRLSLGLIKNEIEKINKDHSFKYRSVTVRNQKTRFGSCSSTGSLNFNWQIIFFPEDKFRHILFHELVHLEIKNHSSRFWQTLGIYDADWKTNNFWLKKEGTKHFIIKP
jgi:predicted metal-dependent hydrolase